MIKIIGTDGNRFYNFELDKKQYSIGRNQDADLVVAHKTVSRNHATIELLIKRWITNADYYSQG